MVEKSISLVFEIGGLKIGRTLTREQFDKHLPDIALLVSRIEIPYRGRGMTQEELIKAAIESTPAIRSEGAHINAI